KWNLILIEDAAESVGSYYKGRDTVALGSYGALSVNGNKIITTGGGGMVLCKDEDAGVRGRHITTTAKLPPPYEFVRDEAGFNYRLPNINAALGCAQMEQLERKLADKRELAQVYCDFFEGSDYKFIKEPNYGRSNYWLNAILCPSAEHRESLIKETNSQ